MNDNPDHPAYTRGIPVSRSALRRVDDLARSVEKADVCGDEVIYGESGQFPAFGLNSTVAGKGFRARLMDQNGSFPNVYSFTAVIGQSADSGDSTSQVTDSSYFAYPSGTFNAVEIHGNPSCPTDATAGAGAGLLVWLTPSAVPDFWEFEATTTTVYAIITSTGSQTVTLAGGTGSAVVYPADIVQWSAGTWTQTSISIWLSILWPGGPVLNNAVEAFTSYVFPCRLLGMDDSTPAVPIYGAVVNGFTTLKKDGTAVDSLRPFSTGLQADPSGIVNLNVTSQPGIAQIAVVGGGAHGTSTECLLYSVGDTPAWGQIGTGVADLIFSVFAAPPSDGNAYYLESLSGTYSWVLGGDNGTITYVKGVNFVSNTVTTGTITINNGRITAFT